MAIAIVGVTTLLVRVVSLAREVLIAHDFGVGDSTDAFFIAFLLPTFVVNVVAGSFGSSLIPVYVEVRDTRGREAAQAVLGRVIALSIALLLAVSLVLALAFPYVVPLLGSSFSSEKLDLTQKLFYILLPVVPLVGLGTIWASVLNAGERFAFAAAVPAITSAVVVLALVAGASRWGIASLAVAVAIGATLEVIALVVALRRSGVRLLTWGGDDAHTDARRVVSQYLPVAAGAVFMSGSLVVDQVLAASLGSGNVAALNFGSRLVMFVLSIAGVAVGSAAIPYFSAMASDRDWEGIRQTFNWHLRLIFAVSIPVVVALWLGSRPLTELLFQHGGFSDSDSDVVAQVQRLYALQIPFYLGGILAVRLISSLRANSLLMRVAAVNLVVNVGLDYLFMRLWGVPGIALATSVVYFFSFLLVWIGIVRLVRRRATEESSR